VHRLLSNISLQVHEKIYLKHPESSDLGQKIISRSIDMIESMGFEDFTFRKLAKEISSTEASVYRYFENKHKLLLYLSSWYWAWMEYQLVFALANIASPIERLSKALALLTREVQEDNAFTHINELKLHRIIISESSKAYLTKEVDTDNKEGMFLGYKQLVLRVSEIIREIDPSFKYPRMMVSTVIEGAHHQRYFAEHLPRLTDTVKGEDAISEFYKEMVFNALK